MVWSCAVTSFRFFGRLNVYQHVRLPQQAHKQDSILFLNPWLQSSIFLRRAFRSCDVAGCCLLAGFEVEESGHDSGWGQQ